MELGAEFADKSSILSTLTLSVKCTWELYFRGQIEIHGWVVGTLVIILQAPVSNLGTETGCCRVALRFLIHFKNCLGSSLNQTNTVSSHASGVPRGEGFGGFLTPPPKFRKPSKTVPNSTRLWKLLKIAEFRTPTSQDVRKKKGSKILKLPPVRNWFTLAMTNCHHK